MVCSLIHFSAHRSCVNGTNWHTDFNEKVKAGKEKASGSGFGGKGLEKLDQERDLARRRERKQFAEEGDEAAEEVTEGIDDISKAATPVTAVKKVPTGPAVDLADKIVVHKRGPTNADPLDRVKQAASVVRSRLNEAERLRTGVPIDNKGPDAGAYHATLEINDFPRKFFIPTYIYIYLLLYLHECYANTRIEKARWAVTNRTNIAKVLEATGTSITTKGSYYPAGKSPQPGQDPKLYILVEGDTELVVTNAMRELKRLLAEGTAAAVDSESRAAPSSRYSVL